ncbi:hypothetical protein DVA67_011730 [Solirubrobacter sp. CPCC 204708]|uniref:Uncharacterized protein n=1 Tax=Solirubrobacter deserti TaxID=2282478 RepID=A0ABT4RQ57_9ACTN|nr:DUF6636 domain-containing protein [Solirubrobacter deserti]MBE2316650.1 hypothetical protein [Solirubrobacter deserti]MDA0140548.1 hypothetical protein [Solirubrobacter deserti]
MSRFSVALALTLAGVAAAAAPADAALREFRSPTGKLACMFYSDERVPRQVRCEWRGGADRAVQLNETGKGRRIKITDTVFNPDAKPLAYGKSTTFGRLKCTSRRSGITCKSLRSGHGFTVSTTKQRVF